MILLSVSHGQRESLGSRTPSISSSHATTLPHINPSYTPHPIPGPVPCHGRAVAGPSPHMHRISLIPTKPNSSRLRALVSGDSRVFSLAVF